MRSLIRLTIGCLPVPVRQSPLKLAEAYVLNMMQHNIASDGCMLSSMLQQRQNQTNKYD